MFINEFYSHPRASLSARAQCVMGCGRWADGATNVNEMKSNTTTAQPNEESAEGKLSETYPKFSTNSMRFKLQAASNYGIHRTKLKINKYTHTHTRARSSNGHTIHLKDARIQTHMIKSRQTMATARRTTPRKHYDCVLHKPIVKEIMLPKLNVCSESDLRYFAAANAKMGIYFDYSMVCICIMYCVAVVRCVIC